MLQSTAHRGPDQSNIVEVGRVTLGIARLSIVDPVGGNQPLLNEDGKILVVGNGEIYNHDSLRKKLIELGHEFRTRSDMEVVVHLFEQEGLTSFSHLDGEFAFALYDHTQGVGYLVRDRGGVKPLYYCFVGETLMFASEIKALLAGGVTPEPNFEQLRLALAYRSSASASTCFAGISKVPPGSTVEFRIDTREVRLSSLQALPAHVGSLTEMLSAAVRRRLMGDAEIGAFVSGGLDSSLIVALMGAEYQRRPFHTFTVGYGVLGDEFAKARVIASAVGTIHHEVSVEFREMTRAFHRIVFCGDEPILDPSLFPTFFLSRVAAQYVKAVLVGDGADEVFAGYDKHQRIYEASGDVWGPSVAFLSARMPFDWQALERLGIGIPEYMLSLRERLGHIFDPEARLIEAQEIDRLVMLPNLQLMRVDKATMAHGLEARVPFLDNDLVSHAQSLTRGQLMADHRGKAVLRVFGKTILPEELVKLDKQVFFVPIDRWMTEGLDKIAGEQIPNSDFIRQLCPLIRTTIETLTPYQKWCLLVVNSWFSTMIDGRDPNRPLT